MRGFVQAQASTAAVPTDEDAATTLSRPRHTLWRIARRTWSATAADNLSLLAAGVAFYALLAIFPGLAFLIAMYGLMSDPGEVQRQLATVKDVLPDEAWNALNTQLTALTRQTSAKLSIASIISLTLALVNARLAAYAMMGALNVVYKRQETRSFFATNAIAFGFTMAAMAMIALSIAAVLAVPQVFKFLGLAQYSANFVHSMRWPVLAAIMGIGLAITYRFGPDGRQGHWRWLTLGSVVATLLWVLGSLGFSWYVEAFNSFDRLYGSFGAVAILLYWLWVTAFAALLGAELDMQIHTVTTKPATA
jgi:membrane protein